MSKEISDDLHVSGDAIYLVIKTMTMEFLAKTLLSKHGLTSIKKGEFYSAENYLGLLDEIENRMPAILTKVGSLVMQEAVFAEGINSFESALENIDKSYRMNHRDFAGDEIGKYAYEEISDKKIRIVSTSLYLCIFNEGIIVGIAKNFSTYINIEHENDICRSKGDSECRYVICIQ